MAADTRNAGPRIPGLGNGASGITALNIDFVAKPNEAHKVHAALPAAINGALGEVGGFAGSFVMIANHEARLITVVTLWSGENRMQRCNENLRWVRALLAPYLDRCLRVQTFAAYMPGASQASLASLASTEFGASLADEASEAGCSEEHESEITGAEHAMCLA